MKKIVKATIAVSLMVFASAAMANPKCSHRVASASNDLFKNTNPVRVAKADTKSGKETTVRGTR
nr:hypothetical protein CKG001_01110 [Bdellovibrio sp. CKG001]BFD61431.1 hypothetical protein BdHM001_01120 [Bdellovibrio sp. HM001]